MTSRIDQIGQNGNDGLAYDPKDVAFTHDDKKASNPFTKAELQEQVVDMAKVTVRCDDGGPCGDPFYCCGCPNDPEQNPEFDPLSDLTISVKPTTYRPSMSELYPKYYKDVSDLTEVDVYAIHDLFDIDDPSGCIQHASKKLLLCGVRTGGKPAATEIKEARDTLTRKLQLMGEE